MSLITRCTATAVLLTCSLGIAACGSGGSGGSDKPSKAEVQKGLSQKYAKVGASGNMDKLSSCMTDKIYDTVSTKTLKAAASSDQDAKGDEKDKPALSAAALACAKVLAPTSSPTG